MGENIDIQNLTESRDPGLARGLGPESKDSVEQLCPRGLAILTDSGGLPTLNGFGGLPILTGSGGLDVLSNGLSVLIGLPIVTGGLAALSEFTPLARVSSLPSAFPPAFNL